MSMVFAYERTADSPTLAVFDFDGTLTYCDTLFPFLRHLLGRRAFWWRCLGLLSVLIGYRLGRMGRTEAKVAVLRRCLDGLAEDRLRSAAGTFAARVLPRLINADALERMRWHAGEGQAVAVVSASLEAYVALWAKAQQIPTVLATRLESVNGRMTGCLDGPNCYGPEKLARAREYAGDLAGIELIVYGDSDGDADLLAVAQQAYYKPFQHAGYRRKRLLALAKALL